MTRSIPVKDPTRLADLFRRGDAARENASELAQRMSGFLFLDARQHPMYASNTVQVALSASTTGRSGDISSRLFSRDFRDALLDVNSTHLPNSAPAGFQDCSPYMTQFEHSLIVAVGGRESHNRGWLIEGYWGGAVGVYYLGMATESRNESLCDPIIKAAWKATIDLIEALGGSGDAYVAIGVWGGDHPLNGGGPPRISASSETPPGTYLSRGPVALSPDALDLASINRELDRALGRDSFEPSGK